MAKGFETATIEQLAREDGWAPIRKELGVRAFGINAWTGREAGARVIPEHDEAPSGHEELYVVTAGRATFTVAGEEIDAPAGTIVFVRDANAKRAAVGAEPGTTVLSVGARPGEAYRPRSWEANAEVIPLFEQGRYGDAKQLLLDALGRYEDQGALLYNLACAEARLGNPDAALDHLAAAIDHRPDLAAGAAADDDLESLRGDSRFAELVGS